MSNICRQFGWSIGSTPEDASNAEMAKVMFQALTSGGPHAYGWLTSDGVPGSVRVTKYAGKANTKAAARHFRAVDPNATIFIGHTRFATHGSPLNLNNNHPVRHGNVVGVHNGIIYNYEKVLKDTGRWKQKDGGISEVDSEAIFAAVNKLGHSAGLRRIDGNMVAVYLNLTTPHLVTMARSEGRPQHLGWTAKGNLFWASERGALLKLEALGIKFVRFSGMREYRMLTIKAGKIVYRYTYDEEGARLAAMWNRRKNERTAVHPLRFDPSKHLSYSYRPPLRQNEKAAPTVPVPVYGRGWEGTALAEPGPARTVEERNGPGLAAYLRSIEEGNQTRAQAIAAAAEVALVERRTPIDEDDDDEDARYFYNGQWLNVTDFISAVADDQGWGDD